MYRCTTSVKTAMRQNYTLIRMAKKELTAQSIGKDEEQLELSHIAGGK